MSDPVSDTTNLRDTMTSLSPDGWEVRIAGACRYRITTIKAVPEIGRKRIADLFPSGTNLEFVEGEINDD